MMSFSRMRKPLLAGASALLFVGVIVGLAFAQQTPSSSQGQGRPERPGMQAFSQALASQLGVTPDRLQQAMQAARTQVGFPTPGPRPQGAAAKQGHRPGGPGGGMQAAAQAIGITTEQLWQELPGKSLAQVAQAHGKNPADVATALKNAASQRIDEQMNHVMPQGRPGGFQHWNGTPGASQGWSGTPGAFSARNGTPGPSPTRTVTPGASVQSSAAAQVTAVPTTTRTPGL